MEKVTFRKILVMGFIVMLTMIYITPAIANEHMCEEAYTDTVTMEYTSINLEKTTFREKISISQQEFTELKAKLNLLVDELNSITDKGEIQNVLESFLNYDDNSFLNKIINYLLNSEIFDNRKLVVSQGGGYNFNPFKDSKTAVMKPLTIWHYIDSTYQFPIPCSTLIVSLNPFEIKTLTGPQMGLMLSFRGLYIQMAQPLPQKSYTFFIGTARFIGGFEFTPFSNIFGNLAN